MTDQRVFDILNDLLAATGKSPHARLAETGVFLSSGDTAKVDVIHRILKEEARFAAELAALLIELGGSPAPAPGAPNAHAARFHYLDLHFMLIHVLRSKKQLLAATESALGSLTGNAQAHHLVFRITAAHREHITLLQELIARTGSSMVGRP